MIEKDIRYEDPSHFLQEFEQNLQHGGLMLEWSPAPDLHEKVKIHLHLPPDMTRVTLEATVVSPTPSGVGVQFTNFSGDRRAAVQQSVDFCRNIVGRMSQQSLPAAPAPPPASSGGFAAVVQSGEHPRPTSPTPPIPQSNASISSEYTKPARFAPSSSPSQTSSSSFAAVVQSGEHPAPGATLQHESKRRMDKPPRGSWISMGRHDSSESQPNVPRTSPEDWNNSSLYHSQEMVWSSAEIPLPSDLSWDDSVEKSPLSSSGYSSPEIGSPFEPGSSANHQPVMTFRSEPDLPAPEPTSSSEDEDSAVVSSELGYAAPSISPPPGSSTVLPAYSSDDSQQAYHLPPGMVGYAPSYPSMDAQQAHNPSPSREGYAPPQGYAPQGYAPPHYRPSQGGPNRYVPPVQNPSDSGDYHNYAPAYDNMPQMPPRHASSEPSWVGDLEETPFLRLLSDLATQEATGHLRAESGDTSTDVYFYKGRVLLVLEEPEVKKHLLGEVLVEEGRINSQERENAIKLSQEKDIPIGEALTDDKIVSKRVLSSALRKQMQLRLGTFSLVETGSFQFWEKRVPRDRKLAPPTSPLRLLFRYKMDWLAAQPYEEAKDLEETYMDRYLFPTEEADNQVEELGFTKEEHYFWDNLLTGRFRLRQIYAASNFRHRRTYTLVFALHAFNLISFEKEMAKTWQVDEMRDFFVRRYMLLSEETFFELLGIHWTASQKEIQKAYRKIKRDYDITHYEGEWPDDIIRMSEEILKHLDGVFEQLHKNNDRRDYRSGVHDHGKLRFSAELFEQQGDMAMYRHDFADAIERYKRALELNPGLSHLNPKIKKAEAAQRKQMEHIRANKSKKIDYEARMQVNTDGLFKSPPPKKKGKDDNKK